MSSRLVGGGSGGGAVSDGGGGAAVSSSNRVDSGLEGADSRSSSDTHGFVTLVWYLGSDA